MTIYLDKIALFDIKFSNGGIMQANTALLIVALVCFASMVYVLDKTNDLKRDISNGVIRVKGEYYLCQKLK